MNIMNRREFLGASVAFGASSLLAACSGSQGTDADNNAEATADAANETKPAQGEEAASSLGHVAIVCFSWSGNTRSMADRIAELAGAAVWDLEPEVAYPDEYNACTDEALAEQREGTLRAYKGDVDGWEDVDTVFLGYPIWWMDLPQITKAFIDAHDWAGKTVVPFSSYFSSGWAGTPEKIADTCEGATLLEGISLAQGELPGALDDIEGWFADL